MLAAMAGRRFAKKARLNLKIAFNSEFKTEENDEKIRILYS